MVRILIAEDDLLVRKTLQSGLQLFGHQVIEADNCLDAIAAAVGGQVEVVVLDLVMPVACGHQALAEIKRQMPEVKAIVMTAWGLRDGIDMLSAAQTLGADRVLNKPLTARELSVVIAQLLGDDE